MLSSLGSRSRPPLEPRACTLRATSSPMRQALASRISPPTSASSPTTSPRCSSAGSTPHAAPPMASLRPPPIPDAPVAWPLLERPPGYVRPPVGVLGVPMDLGQDRRGVDMGPSAIRYARLNGPLEDLGYPVTDLGTVFGVIEAAGRTGLLWLDAHSDSNTPETSPSGNVHGMPLATLTGRGYPDLVDLGDGAAVRAEDVAVVGLRSVDREEREFLAETGVNVYTMKDVDAYGIASVVRSALKDLSHLDR